MTLDPKAVYQLHNNNLGDHWTSYCLMATLGKLHQRKYVLGTHNGGIDHSERLDQISLCFPYHYSPILVPEQGVEKVDPWLNWCFPALAVREALQWEKNFFEPDQSRNQICYQFDGLSSAEDKNPSPALVADLKHHLREGLGFKLIRLGAHLSLAECAYLLSTSAAFIGCDSGMSHIAHSVGCPVYLYEGRLPTYTCHKLKQADLFRDLPEFKMKSEHWFQMLATATS